MLTRILVHAVGGLVIDYLFTKLKNNANNEPLNAEIKEPIKKEPEISELDLNKTKHETDKGELDEH